jgi:hypothetical protein
MTIPSDSVPFPGATPRPVGFYWIRTYGQVQHETVYGDVVSRWTGTEWESPWPVLDLEPIPAMGELRALRTERDALKDEVQRLREALDKFIGADDGEGCWDRDKLNAAMLNATNLAWEMKKAASALK